jgi:hypothetical protein
VQLSFSHCGKQKATRGKNLSFDTMARSGEPGYANVPNALAAANIPGLGALVGTLVSGGLGSDLLAHLGRSQFSPSVRHCVDFYLYWLVDWQRANAFQPGGGFVGGQHGVDG